MRTSAAARMLTCMQNPKTETERVARRSREEWRAEVERWRRSGLDSAKYAEQHGIKRVRLLWWSSQLRAAEDKGRRRRVAAGEVSFLPVRVQQSGSTAERDPVGERGQIEVVLGNGRLVRVVGPVDSVALAGVLSAAEGVRGC